MTTLSAARPIEPVAVHPLRPLPVWQAAILFAVPAAAMALAVYGLWPALTGVGLRKVDGRFLLSSLVMAGLVVAALGRSYGGAVTSCRARSWSMAGGPG